MARIKSILRFFLLACLVGWAVFSAYLHLQNWDYTDDTTEYYTLDYRQECDI